MSERVSCQADENRVKPWTITQLAVEHGKDAKQCQTAFERANCAALYRLQMRELRNEIMDSGRKFTPGEVAVLREFGV